jgi:hypothetical protein
MAGDNVAGGIQRTGGGNNYAACHDGQPGLAAVATDAEPVSPAAAAVADIVEFNPFFQPPEVEVWKGTP